MNSIKSTALGAEQLANRLTDDALAGQEDLRRQIQSLDFKITEIYAYLSEEEGASQNTGLVGGSILKNSKTPKQLRHSLGGITSFEKQLADLEQRVNSRMADSVESLG